MNKRWDYIGHGLVLGAVIGLIIGLSFAWGIVYGPPNPLMGAGPHGSREELGFAVVTAVVIFVRYTLIFGFFGLMGALFSPRKS